MTDDFMASEISSPTTTPSDISSQSSLNDLTSVVDQLSRSQLSFSSILSRLSSEKAALERTLEAHVAQQEQTATKTHELIDLVSTFTEKDRAIQSGLRSLLSKRDASDNVMLEMLQTNAIISSQINGLLGESADNVAEMQHLVDDLTAGMKKVSHRKCVWILLFIVSPSSLG